MIFLDVLRGGLREASRDLNVQKIIGPAVVSNPRQGRRLRFQPLVVP